MHMVNPPVDLRELSRLLSRVADMSSSLNEALSSGAVSDHRDPPNNALSTRQSVLALAKQMSAFRRDRAKLLPANLFGEPAWDILLELFVMRMEDRQVRVKNACIASGVPATTALRWISILERRKLISSAMDASDHRVRWLWLEDDAFRHMFQMIAGWLSMSNATASAANENADVGQKTKGHRQ